MTNEDLFVRRVLGSKGERVELVLKFKQLELKKPDDELRNKKEAYYICYFVDEQNNVATIKCSVRGKMGVIIKELVAGDILYVSGKILAVDGDKTVVKNLKIEKSDV